MRWIGISPRRATPKGHNLHLLHSTTSRSTYLHPAPLRARGAHKIEHRLFSHITSNWRGRPLTSHEVIVNGIAATTTRTGLSVHAELDDGLYPLGVKISDEQMAALPITFHDWHRDWNYCVARRPDIDP